MNKIAPSTQRSGWFIPSPSSQGCIYTEKKISIKEKRFLDIFEQKLKKISDSEGKCERNKTYAPWWKVYEWDYVIKKSGGGWNGLQSMSI